MSTPIHSKSASGNTEANISEIYEREFNTYCQPSHTQTDLSLLQLAKRVPEAEYATPLHSVS